MYGLLPLGSLMLYSWLFFMRSYGWVDLGVRHFNGAYCCVVLLS